MRSSEWKSSLSDVPHTPRHSGCSRRTLLQAGSISLLGLGMNHLSALRASDVISAAATGGFRRRGVRGDVASARSVIFIFLSGGLTQHDSFDPKPDAPAGIRGEFSSIATRVPGIRICEHLPRLAARSELWSQVRSLTSPHNGHSEGHMAVLSGRSLLPPAFNGTKPQPSDWPSIVSVGGAAVASEANNLPPAVVLPERLIHRSGRVIPGQFAGLMGTHRDPWFIEASPFNARTYGAYPDYEFHFETGRHRTADLKFQAPALSLPQGLSAARLSSRDELRKLLDGQREELSRSAGAASLDNFRQAALSLLTDSSVQSAFDVQSADPRVLDRYGRNSFGWSLLMARQLVEAGVSLIQVNLGNDETWDTHDNNFPLLRDCLLPPMDQSVSALLDDLNVRGLLERTLIVMCGEMGRTPRVNALNRSPGCGPGRDHWGAVQTVFMAGGGIPGGVVAGASDDEGAYPSLDPQKPENLAATIYQALGIPATATWKDEVDRPHHIYHGDPINFA
jgi:hypothetical protein